MDIRTRRLELIAFIAVLVTGVVLIWLGMPPDTLATVGVGLSDLYSTWRGHASHANRASQHTPPSAMGS
ncbi:hypothetical protein [Streptomyces sp. NPDC001675]